ncbi:MAG: hypothetical protein QNK05_21690 [Myxococcota bacterium]|nr:hypothetical protein [Myxococcota bacterium]
MLRFVSRGVVASLLLLVALPTLASARIARVTQEGDSGSGSFRAAVEAANGDSRIRTIVFRRGLSVELLSEVVYTGEQSLRIEGRGSEIAADPAAPLAALPDAGLFASRSAADLVIRRLSFLNSFNNGVGVFIPESATGVVHVTLDRVVIDGAQFHGLFVDGQSFDGFNTDDVPHPFCEDPWPFDSAAGIAIDVRRSQILNNGALGPDFDTGEPIVFDGEPALTGCPADFDGIRADDGGLGSIFATVIDTDVIGNLADGIEYDELAEGSVWATTIDSVIAENGETGTDDLDDGFDIDEDGPGDLIASFFDVVASDNRDEGLDLDEAGEGSVFVSVVGSEANTNEDEGIKVDEEDEGNLSVSITRTEVNGSLSQQGIDLTEEGAGRFSGLFLGIEVTGNDDEGVAAAQEDEGTGVLFVIGSDLTGNGEPPASPEPSFDLEGIDLFSFGSQIDE